MSIVIMPSEVYANLDTLNADYDAFSRDVIQNTGTNKASPEFGANFTALYTEWKTFYGKGKADNWIFGASNELDAIEAYRKRLADMRAQLAQVPGS